MKDKELKFDRTCHVLYSKPCKREIRAPKGFAAMLRWIIEENRLPELPFLKYTTKQ